MWLSIGVVDSVTGSRLVELARDPSAGSSNRPLTIEWAPEYGTCSEQGFVCRSACENSNSGGSAAMKIIVDVSRVIGRAIRELFETLVIGNMGLGPRGAYWERNLRHARAHPSVHGVALYRGVLRVAEVEAEQGHWEAASSLYAEAFGIREGEAWHLLAHSKVLMNLGRVGDARATWKKIMEGPAPLDEADRVCREQAAENLERFRE